ncbi:CAAX protease self-immunity [Tessaracoccus bendigoensis DSM 12906]|uniref:CAAX protease self-immunity n=1 Tax=Tessaracoccus bendigoensis DSM 12906 TaxID=1123357 RepID=A0A1M6IFJ2_9ACTN|nr:CPBP family intramembrane glutamic endopeptidase [Tessaracoccus bendigoensis]SHJ33185.1 CAAX protease self-immunity [Tessaracoccus bendigoensis DSM 12906]
MATPTTSTTPDQVPGATWTIATLLPATGVSLSALLLFAFQLSGWGHAVLVASLVGAYLVRRELGKDLLLIGVGVVIVSATSVEADISWERFIVIGTVLILAVTVPLLIDRLIYRRRAISFPWFGGHRWTRVEVAYVIAVPFLGWALLPFYFIRSGAYLNWPNITDASELIRFFVGVNFVGTWDELFFICTCFALLRRHFPVWLANVLQATIFVSFLWELGYREWGPALTVPFALIQGFLFARTGSLLYVLAVHLLFDAIVFMAIVHAHNPEMFAIFVY